MNKNLSTYLSNEDIESAIVSLVYLEELNNRAYYQSKEKDKAVAYQNIGRVVAGAVVGSHAKVSIREMRDRLLALTSRE